MDRNSVRCSLQTALIWVPVATLAFVLWQVRPAVLLAFAAIIVATFLRILTTAISAWTRVPERRGLTIAATLVVAALAGMIWRFGSQMSTRLNELIQQIERGEQSLRSQSGGGSLGLLGAN